FLELSLVDLALGEALLQNLQRARSGLARLGLFTTTRSPVAAAHQHGQTLHSVRGIIFPSRPVPYWSLSGNSGLLRPLPSDLPARRLEPPFQPIGAKSATFCAFIWQKTLSSCIAPTGARREDRSADDRPCGRCGRASRCAGWYARPMLPVPRRRRPT